MSLSVEISRLSLAKWSQTSTSAAHFRKLCEGFSPSLAEDQDNKVSLQCPLKWADGCEVLSSAVPVSTPRLSSDLALVEKFLPLSASSVPPGSAPLQPKPKITASKWFFLTPKCTFLSHLFFFKHFVC